MWASYRLSPEEATALFWSRVNKGAPNGCWEYTRARDKWGYGDVNFQGKHVQAHRLAWRLLRSEPGELDVLHKCNNPPCCNPDHLYLGTDADNRKDQIAARTTTWGERNPKAKLTNQQVVEIRAAYKKYGPRKSNAPELAEKYGVSRNIINCIGRRDTWKYLP